MPTRILFVDDEPNILAGLRRRLRPMAGEWEMEFVSSGAAALEALRARAFDVVVSDMRMPGMDGAELLAAVQADWPQVVRIILSGHSDHDVILRSVGPTHQFLSKPCDPEVLRDTVRRAQSLAGLLADPGLKRITLGLTRLPSMPPILDELVAELRAPSSSLYRIGDIIARDPAMTAQVLRLVNSAFFGLSRRVSSPGMAVTLLGVSTISALVLSAHVFRSASPKELRETGLDRLWGHSVSAAVSARRIARRLGADERAADEAFTAGIVHDTGRLVLALNFPDAYRRIVPHPETCAFPSEESETREFGASHSEVGAYLMNVWGLPNTITEALLFHHTPSRAGSTTPGTLAAVHLADVFDQAGRGPEAPQLDRAYCETLGLAGRLAELEREAQPTAVEPA